MKKDKQSQVGRAPDQAALQITELSALEKLSHGEPLVVELAVRGQRVRVSGRRLKPREAKEVKLLLEGILPPVLPPEVGPDGKPGPLRYDFRDAGYLGRLEEARREARALALWTSFPMFEEGWNSALTPDPSPPGEGKRRKREATRKEIVEFIESRELEDDLLEVLFSKVVERTVTSELVGFF